MKVRQIAAPGQAKPYARATVFLDAGCPGREGWKTEVGGDKGRLADGNERRRQKRGRREIRFADTADPFRLIHVNLLSPAIIQKDMTL